MAATKIPSNFIDHTGQTFGRLTVLHRAENDKQRGAQWFCLCQCGGTTTTRGTFLRRGHTKSCGCLRHDCGAAIGTIHGPTTGPINGRANATHSHTINGWTKTYRCWQSMKVRCTYPNAQNYKYYGGRGITVCDRWMHSFENFLSDMGEAPDGLSIDRYPDNDGNYDPGNCRWATRSQQAINRRPYGKQAVAL